MADDLVATVGKMLRVIAPAMREILTAEELAATTVRATRQAAGRSMSSFEEWQTLGTEDELDEDTCLRFRTFEDLGGSWMQGRETAVEMHRRFRSELQDFVAESGFGWGQLRP